MTECSAIFAILAIITVLFVCASTLIFVINFCPKTKTDSKNFNDELFTTVGDQPLLNSASQPQTTTTTNQEQEQFCPKKCQSSRAKCTSCCSIMSFVLTILTILLQYSIIGNKHGPLFVTGLDQPVTTTIDSDGMLHIVAETHHDVHFAQGLLTAELRLWEMEFQRRVGRGTLSELVGTPGLGHDKMSRTLGLYQAAERAFHDLDNYGKIAINAYCDGVNAYLRSNASLPFEMIVLGVDPYNIDSWKPADSLVWGKIMSLELSGNIKNEWSRFTLMAGANLTYEETNQIIAPFNTSRFPTVLTTEDLNTTSLRDHLHVVDAAAAEPNTEALHFYESYRGTAKIKQSTNNKFQKPAQLVRLLRSMNGPGASNNWVVGGSRTTSGLPMLANDPHLQLTAPSVWLATHLKVEPSKKSSTTKTTTATTATTTATTTTTTTTTTSNTIETRPMDVWGAAFAGVPGIVTGRNAYIAWGVTNTGVDVQDLFVMEEGGIDGTNKNQYKWNDKWINYDIRKEIIRVKNEPDVVIQVRESKTGVVITDNNVAEQLGCSTHMAQRLIQTLALRWVSTDPSIADRSPGCFLKINLARNYTEYREALRDYVAPAQNFIFADINGNIGYQMPGFVPRRANGHTGKLPVSGNGKFSWKTEANPKNGKNDEILSKIDFDHMPRAYNSKKGYYASANNQVVPPMDLTTGIDPYAKEGWVLSHDWDGSNMGYRSRRITDMIETWSVIENNKEMKEMQKIKKMKASPGSQTGQTVQEVKSGHCTSTELIATVKDCQAAAKVLGLAVDNVGSGFWSELPQGCMWNNDAGGGLLRFNTNNASQHACGVLDPVADSSVTVCLCENIKLNMTGFKNMQQDYKSGLWIDFSPYLAQLLSDPIKFQLTTKSLAWIPKLLNVKDFNGVMSIGTIEPTIFQKWLLEVFTLIAHVPTTSSERSAFLPDRMFNVIWILDALNHGHLACGGNGTKDDCLQFVANVLNEIVEPYKSADTDVSATEGEGSVPRWGIDVHRAVFEHQVRMFFFLFFFFCFFLFFFH